MSTQASVLDTVKGWGALWCKIPSKACSIPTGRLNMFQYSNDAVFLVVAFAMPVVAADSSKDKLM